MPLTINVGLSKKVGEPNYGSRGAMVHAEVELDSRVIDDPQRFREKIRQLFGLIRASLEEELNGPGHPPHPPPTNGTPPPSAAPSSNGAHAEGNGRSSAPRSATVSQVKALWAICRDRQVDLLQFLRDRCRVNRPEDLTLKSASKLIDELRALQPAEDG